MTRTARRLAALAVASALLGPSCAEPTGPERPVPGTLTVRWTSPHANDGAAVLRLVVPPGMTTTSLESAVAGLDVFERRTADTLRLALFGTLGSGPLVRFSVPDVRQASRVTAGVVEVAADDDALRESLAGYAVVIERP